MTKIPKTDIAECFAIVGEVTETYQKYVFGGQHSRKSLDFLVECVLKHDFGKPVEIKLLELDADTSAVKAMFINEGDKYVLCLLRGLNFCWSRFVLCKEIFHVYLDGSGYRTIELVSHTESLYKANDVSLEDEIRPDKGLISERLAEFAAMEFLFPYADRLTCIEHSRNPVEIAETYKIPLVLVEKYLTPFNMDLFKRFSQQ
jgi:hypothetical protein